jgi:hypothetical protein
VLDIAFREDACRVRQGEATQNLAVLRQVALNLLRQVPTATVGVKAKRLQAGWDEQYLRTVPAVLRCDCPGTGGANDCNRGTARCAP